MEPASASLPDWLAHALGHAAADRRERVLVLTALPHPALLHLAHAVGAGGQVVAIVAAGAPRVSVPGLLCITADSSAGVLPAAGRFDLAFAAPAVPPKEPLAALLGRARSALRPGGRLVADLPARTWSDDLARLEPLLRTMGVSLPLGFDAVEIEEAASSLALRDRSVTPRTSVQALREVDELLDLLRAALPAGSGLDLDALRLALVEVLNRRGDPPATVLRRHLTTARR